MKRLSLCALGTVMFWAGCGEAMTGTGTDAGRDAGPLVATDAGARDGGPGAVDAGPGDAGPPPCLCPTFPSSCSAPAADSPAFTPNADAVAGQLFDVIACAQDTLKIAIYEAQWDCIEGALNSALAADADLTVEIVVDDDACPSGDCFADTLTPSDRVTVTRDATSRLMHHKFVIADAARVWVGSTNFTRRSFCTDHNNSLVVEQAEIVARYDEMFERMQGGDFAPANPPEPSTDAGDYRLFFSPQSPATDPSPWFNEIVTEVGNTTSGQTIEIMISAFSLNALAISDAMIAAHERGVVVRALISHPYANDPPAQALIAAGIDARRENVHDKVMILNGETVITGSPNWSRNAWNNNENSLWIHNTAVGAAYRAEFDRVFADAAPIVAE